MKPTLEQVLAYAQSDLDAPKPPSPYEIALHLAGALLTGGAFADDRTAAMATAWTLVIPFYQGETIYRGQVQTLYDLSRHASLPEGAAEGDMTPAEGRAYVTGGETGETGEQGEPAPLAFTVATVAHPQGADLQRRQANIGLCDARVRRAAADLEAALVNKRGSGSPKAAQAEWTAAILAQSAAHEWDGLGEPPTVPASA